MSHAATNWAIRQKGLKPATKIVLWHLCDRHHPDHGCFPKQQTLAEDCEMSRSALNVHLDKLEELGLIRRETSRDGQTKQQRPTRYILSFEGEFPVSENRTQQREAVSGIRTETVSGNEALSEKAVSGFQQKPCPDFDDSRVRNPDSIEKTVSEPVREPVSFPPSFPPTAKPKKNSQPSSPPGFEEFWAAYPRQVAKPKARVAYAKALTKAGAATILNAMLAYAEIRRGADPQFTAHPATWLNGERWNDKIEPIGGNNGKPNRLDAMLRGAGASPVDRGPDRHPSQPLLAGGRPAGNP